MIANTALPASALAITSAGAIPTGLIWGTALVWVTVALLLASLVEVLAHTDRPSARGRKAAAWIGWRRLQVCTACAG